MNFLYFRLKTNMILGFCCGWALLVAAVYHNHLSRVYRARWLKIAKISGTLESRINNLACARFAKTGAGFKAKLFYSQTCYPTPSRLHYRAVTSRKLQGDKGHNGSASLRSKINQQITFGFFFSPKMPSCSISTLARALSDTNTIGWHVGGGGVHRGGRRV